MGALPNPTIFNIENTPANNISNINPYPVIILQISLYPTYINKTQARKGILIEATLLCLLMASS